MEIGIVREFSFTSSLQRMSVVTRRLCDQHFNVYCKGSPEMISSLCRPDTVPRDFHQNLDIYAQQGYRVIAVAYKPLAPKVNYTKIQRISREKIECDLEFLGFVILENRLKADTTSVISSLISANIRTIMVTGDNILTAVSVAKDCGMITKRQQVIIVNYRLNPSKANGYDIYYNLSGQVNDTKGVLTPSNGVITNSNSLASFEGVNTCTQSTSVTFSCKDIESGLSRVEKELGLEPDLVTNNYRFALTGKTWAIIKEYFSDLMPRIVTRGTIFARMSPDQKQQLIMELQDLGYYVAMCGDGANDCGALKAAHTGISLSEAESSVASPFTSRNPTISCVPDIIKEGRAALVTSFGIFKYMAAYSLVQFASVIVLYSIDSNLTDFEYLYIDLFMISIFAFFFGKTSSYDGPLVKEAPLNSLIALSPIMSLTLHLAVAILLQLVGWNHVQTYDWFEPFNFTEAKEAAGDLGCHQNYTIFAISCFQYIILAFVFSKGAPYRKSIITNFGLLASLIINISFTLWLVLGPPPFLANLFGLVIPPALDFRLMLVGYGIVNFIIAIFIEMFIVEYLLFKRMSQKVRTIEKSSKQYLVIENDLRKNPSWPPISDFMSEQPPLEEKESPLSYAEISVEQTEDINLENNSVLNSFFEHYDELDDVMVDHPSSESKSSPEAKSPSNSSVFNSLPRGRQDSGIEINFNRDQIFKSFLNEVSSPSKSSPSTNLHTGLTTTNGSSKSTAMEMSQISQS